MQITNLSFCTVLLLVVGAPLAVGLASRTLHAPNQGRETREKGGKGKGRRGEQKRRSTRVVEEDLSFALDFSLFTFYFCAHFIITSLQRAGFAASIQQLLRLHLDGPGGCDCITTVKGGVVPGRIDTRVRTRRQIATSDIVTEGQLKSCASCNCFRYHHRRRHLCLPHCILIRVGEFHFTHILGPELIYARHSLRLRRNNCSAGQRHCQPIR